LFIVSIAIMLTQIRLFICAFAKLYLFGGVKVRNLEITVELWKTKKNAKQNKNPILFPLWHTMLCTHTKARVHVLCTFFEASKEHAQ